jgi:hypothetical protein
MVSGATGNPYAPQLLLMDREEAAERQRVEHETVKQAADVEATRIEALRRETVKQAADVEATRIEALRRETVKQAADVEATRIEALRREAAAARERQRVEREAAAVAAFMSLPGDNPYPVRSYSTPSRRSALVPPCRL